MKCIFCQEKTANSREHILGAWIKKIVQPLKESRAEAINLVSTRDEIGLFSRKRGPIGRAPSPTSATFRIVCGACNNGWMNRIEQAMQSVYFCMFSDAKNSINTIQFEAVRKWLFLKGCLQEFAVFRHQRWIEYSQNFDGDLSKEIEIKKRDQWHQFMQIQVPNSSLRTYIFMIEEGYAPDYNFIDASEISHLGGSPIIYRDQRLFICRFGKFLGIQTNISLAIDYLDELTNGSPYNPNRPSTSGDLTFIEVNPNLIERRLIFRLQAIGPFFGKPRQEA